MRRTICFVLAVVMLMAAMLVFASCKKEITCALCGKTKTTTPHTITVLGKEVTVCEECYQAQKEVKDAIKELTE